MYEKKLQLVSSGAEGVEISKDERYELIASIAQRLNETKELPNVEEQHVWDSNDTSFNIDNFVSLYN